jgi:acyl-CoA thioesterase
MFMRFAELLGSARMQPGACTAEVPEDWTQGRSVFGGLQVALAVRAMRTLVPAEVPLRSLQTSFVAPVPAGTVTVRARTLRQGKSATQLEARLVAGDETLCLVVGIFGQARASAVSVRPQQPAVANEQPIEMPYLPGVVPAFTQHFAVRWLRGSLPFSGSGDTEAVLDIGMRDPGPADEAHLIAIADYIPPLALSHLKVPAPGSSMTWMLELLRDRFDDLPLQGWRVDGQLQAARDGYLSQSLVIWAPNGEAAALSRQSMVVFG